MSSKVLELDELYTYIDKKPDKNTKKHTYVITAVSREPRQISAFDVALDRSTKRIQKIVNDAPPAKKYFSDGYSGYKNVVYPGVYIMNSENKSDTFTVESVNSDLRNYIPGLARRKKCFYRSLDTLFSVIKLFVYAFNKFGQAKMKCRVPVNHRKSSNSKHLHKYKDVPFSLLDFL
jgi:IS1 family transposase